MLTNTQNSAFIQGVDYTEIYPSTLKYACLCCPRCRELSCYMTVLENSKAVGWLPLSECGASSDGGNLCREESTHMGTYVYVYVHMYM